MAASKVMHVCSGTGETRFGSQNSPHEPITFLADWCPMCLTIRDCNEKLRTMAHLRGELERPAALLLKVADWLKPLEAKVKA